MVEGNIREFLRLLGVDPRKIKRQGKWVQCPCPLAQTHHERGKDRQPSFGISINPNGRSYYNCFGCSEKAAPLSTLITIFWLSYKEYPYAAARLLARNEKSEGEEKPLLPIVGKTWETPEIKLEQVPLELISAFPRIVDIDGLCDWLFDRGISTRAMYDFGVRYWEKKNCVLFPHTDIFNRTFMLRARVNRTKRVFTVTPDMTDFDWNPISRKDYAFWFGMSLIDWKQPVYLVEGEFDALRLATLGESNVLASGGTQITDAMFESLGCSRVILGFDADKAGRKATRRAISALRSTHTLYLADWSVVECKDAGDLQEREQLKEVWRKMRKV